MFINACLGRRDTGVNSIIENPYFGYTNYLSQSFPSGDFKTIYFFENRFPMVVQTIYFFYGILSE